MNRREKKQRAKRRSQQWAAEKVLYALAGNNGQRFPSGTAAVLRHGTSITFERITPSARLDNRKRKPWR